MNSFQLIIFWIKIILKDLTNFQKNIILQILKFPDFPIL